MESEEGLPHILEGSLHASGPAQWPLNWTTDVLGRGWGKFKIEAQIK